MNAYDLKLKKVCTYLQKNDSNSTWVEFFEEYTAQEIDIDTLVSTLIEVLERYLQEAIEDKDSELVKSFTYCLDLAQNKNV